MKSTLIAACIAAIQVSAEIALETLSLTELLAKTQEDSDSLFLQQEAANDTQEELYKRLLDQMEALNRRMFNQDGRMANLS